MFLIWIFLMALLQSTEAKQFNLVPQKARAETNSLIHRYQVITANIMYSFTTILPEISPDTVNTLVLV